MSTATEKVDLFQEAVTSAVKTVLPDILRAELPGILEDILPGVLTLLLSSPPGQIATAAVPTIKPEFVPSEVVQAAVEGLAQQVSNKITNRCYDLGVTK